MLKEIHSFYSREFAIVIRFALNGNISGVLRSIGSAVHDFSGIYSSRDDVTELFFAIDWKIPGQANTIETAFIGNIPTSSFLSLELKWLQIGAPYNCDSVSQNLGMAVLLQDQNSVAVLLNEQAEPFPSGQLRDVELN